MATLKLYNPILSEATKECYWFCDEAGTSFKDVDEFINGIPAGDDNIELLLHCDGGEVNEGWAIVDKLRSHGQEDNRDHRGELRVDGYRRFAGRFRTPSIPARLVAHSQALLSRIHAGRRIPRR